MTNLLRRLLPAALIGALALASASAALGWSNPAPSPTAAATAAAARGHHGRHHKVHKPKLKWDPIHYGHKRKREMANYSKRHYGSREWKLKHVRAIVLHYTAGSSYQAAWNTFNANTPNVGELPGVCAQFVVDQDGTVYQLTRLKVRCRHTIGLNQLSIGIEMVQPDLGNPHATAKAILKRRKQAGPAVRLASWLKQRYGVKMRNVIGHGMANDSPLFKDKEGWHNDHVDWLPPQVRTFHARMKKLLHR